MAFDFIKKVFSFGRVPEPAAPTPEREENLWEGFRPSRAPETQAAPFPETWEAPAPVSPGPVPTAVELPGTPLEFPAAPPEVPVEAEPAEPALSPSLAEENLPAPVEARLAASPADVPAPPAELPAATPAEIPPSVAPVEVPQPPSEIPPPAFPVEIPASPQPEPQGPETPPEIPATPAEVPPAEPSAPPEAPPAPAEPVEPEPGPIEIPDETPGPAEAPDSPAPPEVSQGAEAALPEAEVLAPLRVERPLAMAAPVSAEIAPEPAPLPPPAPVSPISLAPSTAREKFGAQVQVGKAVGRREAVAPAPAASAPQGWLQRMRAGLSRSSRELSDNLSGVFTKGRLTEDFVDELEEVLIRSDLGADTAMRVADALTAGRYGLRTTESEIRAVMADEISKVLLPVAKPLELDLSHTPHVILVVGVNGTGKTTTIGKLAAKLRDGGLSVMLAAGDTFRAAAIEQLKIWGERTGSPVVASRLGADAAGLAYEAFEKAREAGADVLVIDTAGRLQNKAELMAELEKIVRVLRKLDPDAPHTVLQTLDATTGQNALNQVEIFKNVAGVSGLVMTKLDGTARGGILVAIAAKHRLPVYFIGVGEGVDDLEPFSARDFAQTIAGTTYG